MGKVDRSVMDNRSTSAILMNCSGSVPIGPENVPVGYGIDYNASSTLRWPPFDVVYLVCYRIKQHIYKGDTLQ
jgi:hypothetical protein